MAWKNPSKYKDEFYKGMCQDYEFQEPLSKLLYFETSKTIKFKQEINSLGLGCVMTIANVAIQ